MYMNMKQQVYYSTVGSIRGEDMAVGYMEPERSGGRTFFASTRVDTVCGPGTGLRRCLPAMARSSE